MSFSASSGEIPGVMIVDMDPHKDERGKLTVTYDKSRFQEMGVESEFILDKHSVSYRGVLRGFHFQVGKHAQSKLTWCAKGTVFDVIVDLRKPSPAFGTFSSYKLTGAKDRMLFLPPGIGHGFLVLSEDARIHYKLDNEYAPNHEAGIAWNDPKLDVDWPLDNPILSERDRTLPTLDEALSRDLLYETMDPTRHENR